MNKMKLDPGCMNLLRQIASEFEDSKFQRSNRIKKVW
jgi:hypothetical protein